MFFNKTIFYSINKLKKFLFFFLFLLLLYILYRSEIVNEGKLRTWYFPYLISLVIFSILIFFLKNKYVLNLVTVTLSTFVGLYAVEFYLLKKSGFKFFHNYDFRNVLEVYNDLKTANDNIFISANFENEIKDSTDKNIFPLSLPSKTKVIHCNEGGFWATHHSDRYGFNNPDDIWDYNKIDLVLVGDSFVRSACVNENDSLSVNLKKLSNLNVLNLSKDDTGTLHQFAILREYFPEKKVKKLIWVYYENDIANLGNELNNKILKKYFTDKNFSQNLVNKQNIINKLYYDQQLKLIEIWNKNPSLVRFNASLNNDRFSYLKLYTVRNIIRERFFEKKKETIMPDDMYENFKIIIHNVNSQLKEKNIKFYFVYLSARFNYAQNFEPESYFKIIKIIKDLDIPLINIHESLKEHPDPLSLFPFRRQLHYNEKGYKFVAEKIHDFIKFEK